MMHAPLRFHSSVLASWRSSGFLRWHNEARVQRLSTDHAESGMSPRNELRDKLRDFAAERDWEQFHTSKNLAMALCVEAAELLEHFQCVSDAESARLPPEKCARVREELADVLLQFKDLRVVAFGRFALIS
jgi:NTP pyrophosphatase (non-canonical NTP hydrolase)